MRRMSADRSSFAVAVRVLRALLLAFGLAVTTLSFVELVDVRLLVIDAAPWWYLGVIGLAAMLVALGSPWKDRVPTD